jgi:hypothetical protein
VPIPAVPYHETILRPFRVNPAANLCRNLIFLRVLMNAYNAIATRSGLVHPSGVNSDRGLWSTNVHRAAGALPWVTGKFGS